MSSYSTSQHQSYSSSRASSRLQGGGGGGGGGGSRPQGSPGSYGAQGGDRPAGYHDSSAGIRAHASASRQSRAQPSNRYQSATPPSRRTAEESDEEYDGIKAQINRVKMDTLESTRNSLRTLEQTDKVATSTLAKLGQQTEQILNIDRKLEQTSITAQDSVAETSRLRTLNKSIFHFSVKNPLTKGRRREQEILLNEDRRNQELRANERRVRGIHESHRRVERFAETKGPAVRKPAGRMDASGRIIPDRDAARGERSRYMLDDEDPEIEDEIDRNLDSMSAAVGRLKQMSIATAVELKAQEDPLRRIVDNADKTSAHVGLASHHLDRIK
ncbi:Protein transport protein S9 plasma membrane t-SNARE [Coemansia javaensis]|uniref:Protein transport protein S9 plasma membrane t-SNARE n=1 Tax=Coemansia javaensis TaxID=2761396 RepID=A0A9W8LHR3_9FUNG|nr:Protein transport protein S9 plasma membrane t-SNARE [Coemansia javaensis]